MGGLHTHVSEDQSANKVIVETSKTRGGTLEQITADDDVRVLLKMLLAETQRMCQLLEKSIDQKVRADEMEAAG